MSCHLSWLVCVLVVLPTGIKALAEVQNYRGNVQLIPDTRELSADLQLTVVTGRASLSGIRFYLNKNLRVHSVTCDICSSHSFSTSQQSNPYYFMIDSAPLTVMFVRPLLSGKRARIRIHYSGKIPTPGWANMFSPTWTELALYSGWFPYDPDSHNFSYDIALKLPGKYKVAAGGVTTERSGRWHIRQNSPTSDIVIIAAPNLQRRIVQRDGLRIGINYLEMRKQELDRLSGDVGSMLENYTNWYGPCSIGSLELVLSSRPGDGAYSRSAFISFPADAYKQRERRNVLAFWAHEIAHLWWQGAPAATWEDWLNESFAEYSSMRYTRAVNGDDEFKTRLNWARSASAGKPPIWDLERSSPDATTVLYSKGALCLFELERMMGTARFEAFTKELRAKSIKNTAELLELLQQRSSPEVRQHFEALLKS